MNRLILLGIRMILFLFPLDFCAAESIKIGLIAERSGPNTAIGNYQINGARLALEEINQAGGVLGRQIELSIEDSKSMNSGSALAFSKLSRAGDIVAVIGPVRSTQILAMMPIILISNIPVLVGGADHMLTHAGNPWIFRVRPHDGYSTQAVADFGIHQLKRRKWAIVHTTETFGISAKNQLIKVLKAYGITPVMVRSFITNTQDLAPLILDLKKADIDILATYITGPTNAGNFAKQLGPVTTNLAWIGSSSIATVTARQIAGEALYGTYAVNDFVTDASIEARQYTKKYQQKFGIEPDFYSAWIYDAVHIIALAIRNANSTQPTLLRKAIFSIQGYRGVEGIYSYDHHGDGLHEYKITANQRGEIVFIKRYTFPSDESR